MLDAHRVLWWCAWFGNLPGVRIAPLIMRSLIRTVIKIGGSDYTISILLSGDADKRYTAEWERNGDPRRIKATRNFTNVHEAKKFAQTEISKAERFHAKQAAGGVGWVGHG